MRPQVRHHELGIYPLFVIRSLSVLLWFQIRSSLYLGWQLHRFQQYALVFNFFIDTHCADGVWSNRIVLIIERNC